MHCPHCMFEYPGNYQFCGNCGALLSRINENPITRLAHEPLSFPLEQAKAQRVQTFGLKALGMFPRISCRSRLF